MLQYTLGACNVLLRNYPPFLYRKPRQKAEEEGRHDDEGRLLGQTPSSLTLLAFTLLRTVSPSRFF